jgi:hypothetical protein
VREVERQGEVLSANTAEPKEPAKNLESLTPQVKPKNQAASREPSLLDEVHAAAREIQARKTPEPTNPTKKQDRGIE